MTQNFIFEVTTKMLMLVLILSMPPIIIATAVGLFVALMQALTQVQEQTLSFAVKLIVVTIIIIVMAPWAGAEMYKFALHLFEIFPTLP